MPDPSGCYQSGDWERRTALPESRGMRAHLPMMAKRGASS
jgi:hypothetical protein